MTRTEGSGTSKGFPFLQQADQYSSKGIVFVGLETCKGTKKERVGAKWSYKAGKLKKDTSG